MRKYLMGRDTFDRHKCLSYLLIDSHISRVLDVGGEGALSGFLKDKRVVSVNIFSGTVMATGMELPFRDGSCEAVVSADTREHIPKAKRHPFIDEMLRVASRRVVICAPLGTEGHIEHEKYIYEKSKLDEASRKYLAEHIGFGLPTPEELLSMAARYNAVLYYHGDYRRGASRPGSRLLGLLKNVIGNMACDMTESKDKALLREYDQYTNRFFMVINKQQKAETA